MWAVYTFIGYLILALLAPTVWALRGVWRRARLSRQVTCPSEFEPALITLDSWYAVRAHALGNSEVRVRTCERWPERRSCGQECLAQIGRAA